MKQIKLNAKKTNAGWILNIPPSISSTGKRERKFFASRDQAERFANPLREKMRVGQVDQIFPKDQAAEAFKAFKLLSIGEHPPEAIVDAVKQWLKANDVASRSLPLGEVIAQFVKARSHLTEKYTKNMENYARRWAHLAPIPICKISKDQIEELLAPLSPHSRNTCMAHLGAIWSFAVKREWTTLNPVERIERLPIPVKAVSTLTAKEIRRLFTSAIRINPTIIPMIALELFAGIRPIEVTKVMWEDIDFAEGVLSIRAEVSKTRRSRHITLHPLALAWLDWHRQQEGATTGILTTLKETTLRRTLRSIRAKAGLDPWHQDCLRHTFASASLASGWRDISTLCLELGHESQKMLHKHYHRALRKADAEAIFNVSPPRRMNESKIIRLAC